MISDAYVDFVCDVCGIGQQVNLPVVYSIYSVTDPHCDLRDSALEELLPKGWQSRDGKHFCEDCKGSE